MNQRILELMAQAGIDVEKLRMYPGGFPKDDLLVLNNFAELIVKECVLISRTGTDGFSAGNRMQEHFGVK